MASSLCPHCQAPLADAEATFCGACGRRVAGWQRPPTGAEAARGRDEALPEAGAPTRRAELDSGMRLALERSRIAGAGARGQASGDVDPRATVRLPSGVLPTAAGEPRGDAGPATERRLDARVRAATAESRAAPHPSTAERAAAFGAAAATSARSDEDDLDIPQAHGARLAGVAALALVVGSAAAGGVYFGYRQLHPPVEHHHPVTVNLDAPATPPPPLVAAAPLDGHAALPSPRRRRGRAGGAPGSTVAPAILSARVAGAAPAVAAVGPGAAARPSGAPTASATATPASAPPVAAAPPASASGAPIQNPAAAPPSTSAAPAALPEELGEEEVLTDAEQKERDEARGFASNITFVLRAHRSQVEGCYERAFKTEKTAPSGRVDIAFTVAADRRAHDIATLTNSTGNERLSKCLEQYLGAWEFPRPPSGSFATSYPFVFSGG